MTHKDSDTAVWHKMTQKYMYMYNFIMVTSRRARSFLAIDRTGQLSETCSTVIATFWTIPCTTLAT